MECLPEIAIISISLIKKISLKETLIFDVPTLKPLNTLYYKDQFNVFVWAHDEFKKIPTADPHTFKAIGDFYAKDDQFVYFIDTVIKTADNQSFSTVGTTFARDKNTLYYQDTPVAGLSDIHDFKTFTKAVAMNQSHIYYREKRLHTIDARSFEHLKIPAVQKSLNHLTTLSDDPLSELYITAFEKALSPIESSYFRDKTNLYYLDHEALYMPDPEKQFKVINRELITDQQSLYYHFRKIPAENVQLEKLHAISDRYFADGKPHLLFQSSNSAFNSAQKSAAGRFSLLRLFRSDLSW